MTNKIDGNGPAKGTGEVSKKRVVLHASDFMKYDFDKVADRAQAVRDILSACGYHEDTDKKWAAHLLDGYQMLVNSGIVPPGIRSLTSEELEIFHTGCYRAVSAGSAPALTDFIALLHPMLSMFNPTVATDAYYRISIGWWFFDPSLKTVDRAGIIVHEVMHGVLGHYELPRLNPELVNLAGDAIINQGIERSSSNYMRLPKCDDGTDMFVFPRTIKTHDYPDGMDEHLSFMTYYLALEDEQKRQEQESQSSQSKNGNGSDSNGNGSSQGNGSDSSQSGQSGSQGGNGSNSPSNNGNGNSDGDGNGNGDGSSQPDVVMKYDDGSEATLNGNSTRPCHEMSPDEINEMDKQDVEKAGQLEKEMARASSQARAMEQAQKSRGTSGSGFNDFILDALMPPKVKWENILKGIISRQFNEIIAGGVDYSYRRPSRRSDPNGFIRPSMIGYAPSVIVGCDTSGSMGESDYSEALGEVEGLLKALHCSEIQFVTIDTEITSKQIVHSAKDVKLTGGGGTMMEPFARFVNELPKNQQPDMTILCTDGYCDWDDYVNELDTNKHNVVLVTSKGGMDYGKKYANGNVHNLTVLPIY